MACFYSSNKGVLTMGVGQTLTGSSVDTAYTSSPTFKPENYDYLVLYYFGVNAGNYGTVWNMPHITSDHIVGFHSAVSIPTGALTGTGTVLSFPFDLMFNHSASGTNPASGTSQSVSDWWYSGYSATGICNVRAYLDGGVPRSEFVNTHYGSGVSAYSAIRTTGGGVYTTSGPYYWNIPDHTTTAESAEHTRLDTKFSAVKNAYSYSELLPLRSLP